MLAVSGSDWPSVTVGMLGVDLGALGFWVEGLAMLEVMVDQAEKLAAKVGC
jgi:oligoendopeptidase F